VSLNYLSRLFDLLRSGYQLIENPDQELESWHQVYSELSDQEIKEIEPIALDRSHFMAQEA